ncbi:MAG: hypothetical protein SFW35_07410 [Chitinophagales bacterium]|nr:hypothetical protein [Chitinophagales bacterium]
MFKYTTNTLNKLEAAFREAGYIVRYEKGNFQAGYCILEHKKVVVVNKYFTLDARINCLAEILATVELDEALLSPSSKAFVSKLPQQNKQAS